MQVVKDNKVNGIDAFIGYAGVFIMLLTISGMFYEGYGFYGLSMTQGTIGVITIVIIKFKHDSVRAVCFLKLPKIKHILGSVVLWSGLFFVVNGITQILMPVSESNLEVAEELAQVMYHPDLLTNLIVVALLPAICEEILFRGLIFKGLSNQFNIRVGVIGSSLLFGTLHFDLIRVVPTTILGLGICYAVYKSGSIATGMIIHFINNALVVLVNHFVPIAEEMMATENIAMEQIWIGAVIVIGIGMIIIGISVLFFKTSTE